MDRTDLEILRLLSKDPQKPFSRIADEVYVSPRTVQKRVQKLKKNGTILGTSIIVNLSKLGYQGEAFVQITVAPGYDKVTTIDALKKIKNIFLITEIIGDFDIMAIAAVKDYSSIVTMVSNIRQLPSVEKAEADFVTGALFPATTTFNEQLIPETSSSH